MPQPRFTLCVETHFAAAHHLRGYPGDCARPHGHNWHVSVFVACTRVNDIGIAVDFKDLKRAVTGVIEGLDHNDLNTLPAFAQQNPSTELVAQYLYRQLSGLINNDGARIERIVLEESPSYSVTYSEDLD